MQLVSSQSPFLVTQQQSIPDGMEEVNFLCAQIQNPDAVDAMKIYLDDLDATKVYLDDLDKRDERRYGPHCHKIRIIEIRKAFQDAHNYFIKKKDKPVDFELVKKVQKFFDYAVMGGYCSVERLAQDLEVKGKPVAQVMQDIKAISFVATNQHRINQERCQKGLELKKAMAGWS